MRDAVGNGRVETEDIPRQEAAPSSEPEVNFTHGLTLPRANWHLASRLAEASGTLLLQSELTVVDSMDNDNEPVTDVADGLAPACFCRVTPSGMTLGALAGPDGAVAERAGCEGGHVQPSESLPGEMSSS